MQSPDQTPSPVSWAALSACGCAGIALGAAAGFALASAKCDSRQPTSESTPSPSNSPSPVVVSDLLIYPIKSCGRGVRVASARVTPHGLEGDRMFVVTDSDNNFVSQRAAPAMALLAPHFHEETGDLIVSCPGYENVVVSRASFNKGEAVTATVWGDKCKAIDQGEPVAELLSSFLDTPGVRLRRMAKGYQRRVKSGYVQGEDIHSTSFADKYVPNSDFCTALVRIMRNSTDSRPPISSCIGLVDTHFSSRTPRPSISSARRAACRSSPCHASARTS
jgi:MOSC N-terminal beta barrel domain